MTPEKGLANLAVFADVAESIKKSNDVDIPPSVSFLLLNGFKFRLNSAINLKHEKLPKMDWRLHLDEFYFKAGVRKNTIKLPVMISTKRHHFRYCLYNDEFKVILNFDGLSLPSRISDGEMVRAVIVFKVITLKDFLKEIFTTNVEEPLIWRLWSFISPDVRFTIKRDHRDETKSERELILKDIFDLIFMKSVDPMVRNDCFLKELKTINVFKDRTYQTLEKDERGNEVITVIEQVVGMIRWTIETQDIIFSLPISSVMSLNRVLTEPEVAATQVIAPLLVASAMKKLKIQSFTELIPIILPAWLLLL